VRVKFALEQVMKVQNGSRDTDLLSFNLGARLWWVINVTLQRFNPEN
jgi:hypothetical protein